MTVSGREEASSVQRLAFIHAYPVLISRLADF